MDKQLVKDALGWGFVLWLVGYILGFIAFALVPPDMIGWVIAPVGVIIALWILIKKVKAENFQRYAVIAVVWTVIAIALDYLFIVKALHPVGGYYKPDVYLYYTLTFILPLIVGWRKKGPKSIMTA